MQERCFASKKWFSDVPKEEREGSALSRKSRSRAQTPPRPAPPTAAVTAAARDTQGVQTAQWPARGFKGRTLCPIVPWGTCVWVCVCLAHAGSSWKLLLSETRPRRTNFSRRGLRSSPPPWGSRGKGRRTFYFFTCFRHTPPGKRSFWSAGLSAGECFWRWRRGMFVGMRVTVTEPQVLGERDMEHTHTHTPLGQEVRLSHILRSVIHTHLLLFCCSFYKIPSTQLSSSTS